MNIINSTLIFEIYESKIFYNDLIIELEAKYLTYYSTGAIAFLTKCP